MVKKQNLIQLWDNYTSLTSDKNLISFISGRPGQEAFNFAAKRLIKIIANTAKFEIKEIIDYSPVDGLERLKKVLIRKYQTENIFLDPKDIFITSGSQQAIDIFLKAFLKPGNKILLARENYIGLQQSIFNCQAEIMTLSKPIGQMTYEQFEQIFKKEKISLFYLASDFANPTGETLSLAKRKEIIKLSCKYHFQILEDQVYRDLVFNLSDQIPSLRSLNQEVNFVGSISKTIIPGLRIGWLTTNKKNRQEIYNQKRAVDLQTPYLNQSIIAQFIENSYFFQKHLQTIRSYYQEKMKILLNSLKEYFPEGFFWNEPQGGFFVWAEGPKKLDSRILFKKALKNGIGIMPGFVFSYGKPQYNNFRLSISAVNKNQIEEGVKKIVKTIKES